MNIKRLFVALTLLALPFITIAQSNVIDKIVARVGNEYILKSEIESMYMQETGGGAVSNNADMRAEILEQLLIQKLLCAEAYLDSVDVYITDVDVKQAIDERIQQMIQTIGSQERLEQYFGQTIKELVEDMYPSYHSGGYSCYPCRGSCILQKHS